MKLKKILRDLDQLSPVVTRPRCVLIIYGRISGITKQNFDKALEDLFRNAWYMKFLDFTIVHILPRRYPVIRYLNPFQNLIVNFSLTTNSTSTLFPNKLKNVKNHTMRVPVPHIYNGTCVFRDKNGELEHFLFIKADFYIFLKQFFDYTNIGVIWDVEEMSYMIFTVTYTGWLRQLSRNGLSVLPVWFQRFGNRSLSKQVEVSRYFHFSGQEIFVPNIKTSKFNFPFELLETSLLFAAIIFSFYIVARALRFSKKHWNVKNITFLLVGVKVDGKTWNFFERVFIVCLSMLSLTVTSDLIGSFLGFLREEELVTYQTLNDINNTKMQILIFDHNDWIEDEDDVINDIMAKTTPVQISSRNFEIFQNPFIFIGPRLYAATINSLIRKLFPAYPNYILPSNITLYSTGKAFAFEKNSPYVDTFDIIALRTKEFGLDIAAESKYNHRCKGNGWFSSKWETPHKSEDVSGICIFIFFVLVLSFQVSFFYGKSVMYGKSTSVRCFAINVSQ